MTFTRDTAAAAGRKGGATTAARYGRPHMQAIGRLGFAALARKLGYVGGSRRVALQRLIAKGKLSARGPDQGEAIAWAEAAIEALDPDNPEIPY